MREYLSENPFCEVCGKTAIWVHHKHPKSKAESYVGDIHEDENLCSVCADCHSTWGSARYVGDQPSPRGNVESYARGYMRLQEDHPGKRWHEMAPQWLLSMVMKLYFDEPKEERDGEEEG